jgi:transposase
MTKILSIVEKSSTKLLYALDETFIKVESDNRRTWSPIGNPPIIEKNNLKKGLKLIGATEISKKYDSFVDAYQYKTKITSDEFIYFAQHLLDINENKKVYIILDNARIHKSLAVRLFRAANEKNLKLIYLPPYSPDLNPQENVWNRYKACIHTNSSKSSEDILFKETCEFYDSFNNTQDMVKNLVSASKYYCE